MNYLFFSLLFSNKRIMITSIINNIILIITSIFIISKHCSVSQILKITKASQELCESHAPSFKKLPVYPFNCLCFLHIFTHLCFRGFSCIHPSNPAPSLLKRIDTFFRWLASNAGGMKKHMITKKKITEAFAGTKRRLPLYQFCLDKNII